MLKFDSDGVNPSNTPGGQVNRTAKVHETRRRRVRDLPSLGRPTTLVVRSPGSSVGVVIGSSLSIRSWPAKPTRRLARTLVSDVRKLTIRELARGHRLGWHLIMGVVRGWAETVAAQPSTSNSSTHCTAGRDSQADGCTRVPLVV